ATEAAYRNRTVEMHNKISDRTAQNCFKGFKEDSYIALQIRPKSDRPEAVNLEELKGKVEENSITSTQKFVEKLGHSKYTICRILYKLKNAYRV
ncbi:hypothetical protein AVEN_110048-1, partial [Araneus ventricosus]